MDTNCQRGGGRGHKMPEGRTLVQGTLSATRVDTNSQGMDTKCQKGGH